MLSLRRYVSKDNFGEQVNLYALVNNQGVIVDLFNEEGRRLFSVRAGQLGKIVQAIKEPDLEHRQVKAAINRDINKQRRNENERTD